MGKDEKTIKLARIRNTLHLAEMEISEPLLTEVRGIDGIEILGAPLPLAADPTGYLLQYPYEY